MNLGKHRQGKFESVPLAKLILYQFSVPQGTEIFILIVLKEWPWCPTPLLLHYMILIAACILVFLVRGTILLTPSLEETVSLPAPEQCNLETAVVCAQTSGSGCMCGQCTDGVWQIDHYNQRSVG